LGVLFGMGFFVWELFACIYFFSLQICMFIFVTMFTCLFSNPFILGTFSWLFSKTPLGLTKQ